MNQPFAKIAGTLTAILGTAGAAYGWSQQNIPLTAFGAAVLLIGIGAFVVGRFQE